MVTRWSGAAGARRRIAAALLGVLALTGCATGSPPGPATPAPASTMSTQASATASSPATISVDGRSALLYLPTSRPEAPTALVVVLHGYTAEAAGAVEFLGLRAPADRRGVLLVAPQGTTDPEGNTFWNASHACCDFHDSGVDDAGYLSRLIAAVAADHPVDPGRVYVVGHSNGGFMAHRMACDHAGEVAAVASLAGALDADGACAPERPVSVLQVHGTADESIGYDGGDTSAAGTVAAWRGLDGCGSSARRDGRIDADASLAGDDLTETTWTGCRDRTEVALWTIDGGSHVPALTPAFASALLDWLEAHRR
jgi:polyhydroxybutyrate depolymerase